MQKTAYEMRMSDWISDVCSVDHRPARWARAAVDRHAGDGRCTVAPRRAPCRLLASKRDPHRRETDHARTDRKSVVYGKSVSVRVALGGRRIILKTHQTILLANFPYNMTYC